MYIFKPLVTFLNRFHDPFRSGKFERAGQTYKIKSFVYFSTIRSVPKKWNALVKLKFDKFSLIFHDPFHDPFRSEKLERDIDV